MREHHLLSVALRHHALVAAAEECEYAALTAHGDERLELLRDAKAARLRALDLERGAAA